MFAPKAQTGGRVRAPSEISKMITRKQLIKKYIEFFKSKEHKEIPNCSLIPENDSTALFIIAGMQPIAPYLLGEQHPLGKRLVNTQRCIRTVDIEDVGDSYHHTFFEMIGNWSLGDYWKREAIELTLEFFTKILKIPLERLAVTCFKGNENSQKDDEAIEIWRRLGLPEKKIALLEENWWGPAGQTGPCGPNTEIFYWRSNDPVPEYFDPKDEENWVEIGNDVLMEYVKDKKVILVDGMHCAYDKDFKPNKELLDFINNLNTHTIFAVKGFKEKGKELVKNYDKSKSTNWEAFSLEEEGIKKDNQEYFKRLLAKFNLSPEEVIYFDHKKESVETARKLGILSMHYTDDKSIMKFIEDNLLAYFPAKQKNIDFGGGLERTLAVLNGFEDNYETEVWKPIIEQIEKISKRKYEQNKKEMRIIADHLKASVFIIADGITPSNTEQGYVLRRLIRRAVRYGKLIGMKNFTTKVAEPIFKIYDDYEHLQKNKKLILDELQKEETKFNLTLEKGLRVFEKIIKNKTKKREDLIKGSRPPGGRVGEDGGLIKSPSAKIPSKDAFLLYQSYGFPIEMTKEIAKEKGIQVDEAGFEKELAKHQQLSRTASAGKFKSGLADNSEATTKLHTATHLLLRALQIVLKDDSIIQKGSNITPERLRFDFSFPRKLTKEELGEVENLVNAQIQNSCEVLREEMSPSEARKKGARGIFDKKYGNKVSVYSIGDFSKEICAGPHVGNTCELGKFKILKETSSSAGVRRIKAILE